MSQAKLSLIVLLSVIIVVATVVSGCTTSGASGVSTPAPGTIQQGTTQATSPDAVVLTINGSVSNPLQLTLSAIDTYPAVTVNMTAAESGRNGNFSSDMNRTWPGNFNETWPSGTGGNWPSDAGSGMMPGAGGYFPGGADGSMPDSGDFNASYAGRRSNNSMNVTGISLNSLLDRANPLSGAKSLTCFSAFGTVRTIPLSDVRAQADAVIIITGRGMLQLFVPGSSSGDTVIDLTGIEVN